MPNSPIEDWGQTLGAGIIGATVPLVAGKIVQLTAPEIVRRFSADPIESPEAIARTIASWVVLVSSPVVVFLCARWAARVTHGSPLMRAAIVGLTPGALFVAVIARRAPSAFLGGVAPFHLWAVLIWSLFNLGCGVLGAATRRRYGAA